MKYFICCWMFLFSCSIFALEYHWQVAIANKQTKDILDYFNLIPSEFINCEGAQFAAYDSIQKRAAIINEVDKKNGYLEFYNGSQIVLFKDRVSKRDIIGIQSGKCGAGTTCGAVNGFYILQDSDWIEVKNITPFTPSLIDALYSDDICPYYDLPRYGLKVNLMDEFSGQKIHEMTWEKDQFVFD